VAALRLFQVIGHPAACKIIFIAAPFVGTNIYFGAISSFLRSNKAPPDDEIESLQWRAGEWPGALEIRTKSGTYRTEKFYYNYLIPFYVTRACQLTPDFSNELADISVGDAWSPKFENQGGGHAIVVSRSKNSKRVLDELEANKLVHLEAISVGEALDMHGHMYDFKKRGSFLRMRFQKLIGKPTPHFGYHPSNIPLSRILVEVIISGLFLVGRFRLSRWIVQQIPISMIGPFFNRLRLSWKRISRTTKRKGLGDAIFIFEGSPQRWQELNHLSSELSSEEH
jgi:coenzyme F420 hydrogenase subunit beta